MYIPLYDKKCTEELLSRVEFLRDIHEGSCAIEGHFLVRQSGQAAQGLLVSLYNNTNHFFACDARRQKALPFSKIVTVSLTN